MKDMCRLVALVLVFVLGVGLSAPAAYAGHKTATNVALGLASFAVFNQLFGPVLYPRPVYAYAPVYVAAPPPGVVYLTPPQFVTVPPPPAPMPAVVQYPYGRYELRGDGVATAYHWVWIPNPPARPPASYQQPGVPPSPPAATPPSSAPSVGESCKPTGKYVKTPQGLLPECE